MTEEQETLEPTTPITKHPPVEEGIINAEVSEEMRKAYLDYAMSVIVSRAIPSIEDGMKPVQRRILYAMHQMGLKPTGQTKKSARVVGEVMGKYHPHGDSSIYEAMVRMAQTFSLRYPLVYGQGNFGSIDGDSPAAMRYTEAKLQKLSFELLEDIEKETVQFVPNYDGSVEEPSLLPGKLPALMLNGATGIAVGMATNIPPHNLTEVCDALIAHIQNPEISKREIRGSTIRTMVPVVCALIAIPLSFQNINLALTLLTLAVTVAVSVELITGVVSGSASGKWMRVGLIVNLALAFIAALMVTDLVSPAA